MPDLAETQRVLCQSVAGVFTTGSGSVENLQRLTALSVNHETHRQIIQTLGTKEATGNLVALLANVSAEEPFLDLMENLFNEKTSGRSHAADLGFLIPLVSFVSVGGAISIKTLQILTHLIASNSETQDYLIELCKFSDWMPVARFLEEMSMHETRAMGSTEDMAARVLALISMHPTAQKNLASSDFLATLVEVCSNLYGHIAKLPGQS
jgi:hypothetical protein